MKILILAGGSGTRLWPLSRISKPKQVQPFLDSLTLLQHTWKRLRNGFSATDIFVSTTSAQVKEVRRQLPELRPGHLIVEPVGRNTAPAIGLAALILNKVHANEIVATVNSDHYIADSFKYLHTLKTGEKIIKKYPKYLLLLGIKPSYPETGYGYIKLGKALRVDKAASVFKVSGFTEKPDLARARAYLKAKNYLWNSGLFVFYPRTLLELVKQHATLLGQSLFKLKITKAAGTWRASAGFLKLPSLSLDYAVIEKTRQLLVLPAKFDWSDVGHWRTIYDILSNQHKTNVSRGNYLGLNSQGNIVYSHKNKLIATVGVDNFVIIDTKDALLVCPQSHAQEVKAVVEELKKKKLEQYL